MTTAPTAPVRAEHTGPSLRTVVGTMVRSNRSLLPVALSVITAAVLLRLSFDVSFGYPGDARSVWEGSGAVLRWLFVVFAVGVGTVQLPVLVAHGVTRGRVAAATTVLVTLVAVVGALVVTAGLLVERVLSEAAGNVRRPASSHVFDDVSQVQLVLAEYTLVLGAWLVTG